MAAETREGYEGSYAYSPQKLEEERVALGGGVFDVLGKVFHRCRRTPRSTDPCDTVPAIDQRCAVVRLTLRNH